MHKSQNNNFKFLNKNHLNNNNFKNSIEDPLLNNQKEIINLSTMSSNQWLIKDKIMHLTIKDLK